MNNASLLFSTLKLSIVLHLLFAISSCKGQVSTQSQLERSKLEVTDPDKMNKEEDSLFFIPGQLCQHLRTIFQDSKGNLWFGTNVYDLMIYNGDTLKYLDEKDGFSGGRVTGIIEDAAGDVWFATSHGLNKYDGESFTVFTENNGIANREIWSLISDNNGGYWIGHNEGISHFDGITFKNISVPKPQVQNPNTVYYANRVTALVQDRKGNLWLGTDGYGISKYDGVTFTSFTAEDGLADNAISNIIVDSTGDLWIGTFWGGLSTYDGDTFINYTKNGDISGVEISALYKDKNNDIWVGIENNGVYKYDGNSFTHFDQKSISNASILSIYRDKEDRLWLGGWGGLFKYQHNVFTPVTKDGPWK